MNIEYKKYDSTELNFENDFSNYEEPFYDILSKSYPTFYGKDYHKERIKEGKAIIYLGLINGLLIGVSYVKRNKRRGGIAVYPEINRGLGVANNLVRLSLEDFPKQYSILSTNFEYSIKMLTLLKKNNFKPAVSEEEIKLIVGDEAKFLSNFRRLNDYLVFDRESEKRGTKREFLTLLHTF